jgi:hypothetical protein
VDGATTGVSHASTTLANRSSNASTNDRYRHTVSFVIEGLTAGSHTVKFQTHDNGTSMDRSIPETLVLLVELETVAGSGGGVAYSGAKVTRSADQAFAASGGTMSWDQEDWDTDTYHDSTNPSRLTIPEAGFYRVTAHLRFSTTETGSFLSVVKNGDSTLNNLAQSQGAEVLSVVVEDEFVAGDYVEAVVFTPTASTVKAGRSGGYPEAFFSIERLDPESGVASIPAFVGVRVTETTDQSIASGGSGSLITFSAETHDTDGFHSTLTDTSRLTVPAGKDGYYRISARVRWDNVTGGTYRRIRLLKNGTEVPGTDSIMTTGYGTTPINQTLFLAAGDYVELSADHDRGSAANIKNSFSAASFGMELVGT